MIRHVLPGLTTALLVLSLSPGASAQAVSEPVPLPGDAEIGAAAGIQQTGSIARGGDRYLVAWADLRTDFVSTGITTQQQTGFDLYVARLDAEGQLLDAVPIVVSQTFGSQTNPRVAWNGENWLVAWRNQSPTTFYYADEVLAARVAPDGTVLDDPPISVKAYQSSSSSSFVLTSNGPDWLVVSQGTSAGEGGLLGTRIAADGTVLDPGGAVLVPATYFLYFGLALSSAGGEYLLVYEAQGSFEARRFQADLTPVGSAFTVPGNALASSGTGYYVLWTSGGSLVGSPMTVGGTLQFPAGVPIASPPSLSGFGATWDGTRWWTTWRDPFVGVSLARVEANGTVVDNGGVVYDPALEEFMTGHLIEGAPSGGVQMIWTDDRLGTYQSGDVFSAAIASDTAAGREVPVSVGAPTQRFPDLAAGTNGFLTVFRSDTSADQRILAQRLDATGAAIDAEPFEIASGPWISLPHVAWDGTRYLVVWAINGQTFGRRVLPDGTIVDGAPLLLAEGFSPDVAALGGTFLVVYTQQTIGPHFVHPFAARVSGATGAVVDATPIGLGQYFARSPHVTTFGNRWLATWQRNVSHDDPYANVMAAIVEADGTTTGEFFVAFGGGQPDVAVTEDTALFVWRTGTDSSSDPDLAARIMAVDGTFPGAAFVLADVVDKQLHPRVAWTGTEFLAAWEDMRNAAYFFDERTDLYGARVGASGTVLDPGGFPLVDMETPAARPVLARMGSDVLMAGALFLNEPYAAYRVSLVTIGGDGPGTGQCFGIGCPCGNDDPAAGCANSTGVGGLLGGAGSRSVGADDLVLTAVQLPTGNQGLFYMGDTLVQNPFLDGFQCALGVTFRYLGSIQSTGAGGTMTLGPGIAGDAGGLITAGGTWHFHAWHRDVPGSPCGSGANLTNLYSVTFAP